MRPNTREGQRLLKFAEAYLEDNWDEDRMGDPDHETFEAAVKDFAERVDGAVADAHSEWLTEWMADRQAAVMDARPR